MAARVDRVRLLYLYPSELDDRLVDAICATGVPYFDLSLQHASKPLLRRMRRWGDGDRFLRRIDDIRRREPDAAFRSSFIVGYPGETEEDHDALLRFVEEAQLDWAGFFAYSREDGTYAAGLDGAVDAGLVAERLLELWELQDRITAVRRSDLIGEIVEVLVDEPGVGRSHREAPEIDGIVAVPEDLPVGAFATVTVTGAAGPDLEAARRACGWPTNTFGPSALATPANAVTMVPHPGPAAAGGPDPRRRLRVAGAGPVGRAGQHRPASTAGWPAARAPPARAPSSTPWPTRCWCSGPWPHWWPRGCCGGCRWRSSPCGSWC